MSTLKANTLSNVAGSKSVPTDTVISGSAKAWVNFNGTGTVAIRDSFNVSSITDNGVGNYSINFMAPLPDANYAIAGGASTGTGPSDANGAHPFIGTAAYCRIWVGWVGTAADVAYVTVVIFR